MKKFLLILIFSLFIGANLPTSKAYALEKASASSAVLETPKKKTDERAKILEKFLESYNSPLSKSARTFVGEADKNKIDWKFVAAISGVESTFGHQIPYNSYNAWGWGIYGDNMIRFNSYDEGIKVISKSLREQYINSWKAGDVYAIGRLYAASPTWAQRVEYFMKKIDEFALKNPGENLSLSI